MTAPIPQTLPLDDALHQAVVHHQAGRLQEAEKLYRAILQAQPNHPDANHNLGVLAVTVKQPAAGLPHLKAALDSNPNQSQYWLSYVNALIQAGQIDAAEQVMKNWRQQGLQGEAVKELEGRLEDRAQIAEQSNANQHTFQESPPVASAISHDKKKKKVKAKSTKKSAAHNKKFLISQENMLDALFTAGRFAEAATLAETLTVSFPLDGMGWKALGVAFKQMGRNADALASLQKAAALMPRDAEAHRNLGIVLKDLGQLDDAAASFRRAVEIQPDFAAHNNLGILLKDLGQLDNAAMSFRRALEIDSDSAEAHNNLGNALLAVGQIDSAMTSFRRALEIKPDFAAAHSNLGNALTDCGRLDDAAASYRRALEINPDSAEAHNNLGNVLRGFRQLSSAEASYRRALEIKQDFADAHSNLGSTLTDLGQLDDAVTSFRRALAIKPDFSKAHSNLIFAQDLAAGVNIAPLQQERSRWNLIHAAPLAPTQRPHGNRPDPERRLRIGYVSADFRVHSAAYVFGAMLIKFDRACFDVFAYSNSTTEDSDTRLFQQAVTCWRKIVGLSDEAVADLIRQDEIDILVDLSGHSAGNRLLVFARKPAPIQVTAWGYIGGTGMQAMDVFFADPVVVPPEEKHYYAEEVRYLPNVVGYYFSREYPAVKPLPALSANRITFGSFNRLTKVSDEAYQVWARVLLSIPNSRMMLKTGELDDVEVKSQVLQHFIQGGVDPARITLLGRSSWPDHMAAFGQVDITLDPFPQGGGVTTLEGLMMGVPIVTLRWPTLVGRLSASILTTMGLTDWIAETPEQYIEIACQKAQDLSALADLREKLRSRLTASIIGDSAAYVRAVEHEYRILWQRWCEKSVVSR